LAGTSFAVRPADRAAGGLRQQLSDAGLSIGLTVAFLLPVALRGPADVEEYPNTIISALLNALALRDGRFLLWTDDLGFGTPLPIGHDKTVHPLFWLWPDVSLSALMLTFWAVHLAIAAYFYIRLLRMGGAAGPVVLAGVFTYLFCAPTLTVVYQNDWPSLFLNWALYPVIVFYGLELTQRQQAIASNALKFALVLGFAIATAHFGHLAVLLLPLAAALAYLAAVGPRAVPWLAFAVLLAALIGSANMAYVISEARLFPTDIVRDAQAGYGLKDLLPGILAPLPTSDWRHVLAPSNAREPKFGLVLMILAFAAVAAQVLRNSNAGAQIQRASAAAFVLSLGLMFLDPPHLFNIPSGTWLFRDPLAFYGILLACWLMSGLKIPKPALYGLVIAQVLVVSLQAFQSMRGTSPIPGHYYGAADAPTGVEKLILSRAPGKHLRVYFSPQAEALMMRGKLAPATADLALHGLRPINGWFKGVATDAFFPSRFLMHGFIRGHPGVLANQPALTMLGVALIVATPDDAAAVGPGYRKIAQWEVDGESILLLHNGDAWPEAWFMPMSAERIQMPRRWPQCPLPGLLCADVAEFAAERLPGAVALERSGDYTVARFAPQQERRLLVFSSLYREGWQAQAGERVVEVANALRAVEVPPGVAEIRLHYRPEPRSTLRIIGLLCAIACAAVLAVGALRRLGP
jgi:hypothetical protein